MRRYIHTVLGLKPLNKITNNNPLFFEYDDGIYYNMEKDLAKDKEFGGYLLYTIDVPDNMITTSLYPTSKKILKITKDNLNELKKIIKLQTKIPIYQINPINHIECIQEFNPNIIGLDLLDINNSLGYFIKTNKKGKKVKDNCAKQGYIWEIPSDIKIKLYSKTIYYQTIKH